MGVVSITRLATIIRIDAPTVSTLQVMRSEMVVLSPLGRQSARGAFEVLEDGGRPFISIVSGYYEVPSSVSEIYESARISSQVRKQCRKCLDVERGHHE